MLYGPLTFATHVKKKNTEIANLELGIALRSCLQYYWKL